MKSNKSNSILLKLISLVVIFLHIIIFNKITKMPDSQRALEIKIMLKKNEYKCP
jgi:hypothetical protein